MIDANRFDQLIDGWSPRLQKAFLKAVYQTRDDVQIGLVAELLEKGDIDGALRAVGLDPVAFNDFDQTISDAYADGGRFTTDGLPALRQPSGHRLEIRFNVRNPRAEADLRQHSSNLVTEIVADQRQMVRQVLTAAMEAGENLRTVALDIAGRINAATGKREGGLLGLTSSQEQWVRSFKARLASGDPAEMRAALGMTLRDKRFDRTVEKAIREERPVPAELLSKMVAAYKNRALRYRGEAIGRTEAMWALHKGAVEAAQQAIDAGQVQESAVQKVWHSAADNRVRETHRALNSDKVGFRAEFVSPSGARLLYPGDPGGGAAEVVACRCWMDLRVDFLSVAGAGLSEPGGGGSGGRRGGASGRPPKPPSQSPKPDRYQLDEAAKAYVLLRGLADGKEHLAGYDLDTAEPIEAVDSLRRDFVGFPPDLIRLIEDPGKRIVLHHNHPSGTSLSRKDLQMLVAYRGMHEVFAHGHDGSEYRAAAKGKADFDLYNRIAVKVFDQMRGEGRAGRLDIGDAQQVFGHVVNSIFASLGYIDYTARLEGKSFAAYSGSRPLFEALISSVAKDLK